ncbi:MAG: hypothetical protein WC222_11255 [Parachlamydiales bacterium]
MLIPCTKKYPLPLPYELVQAMKKLRKYLLELNNYWINSYNEHIHNGEVVDRILSGLTDNERENYLRAKTLWESTTLQKIYKRKNGYILSGKMESITSRFYSVTTPLIDPDDGYENFGKMQTGIDYCFTQVAKFVDDKQLKLMDAIQYAGQLFGSDSDETERVKNMSPKSRTEFMVQTLESKGYIVMGQDDIQVIENQQTIEEEELVMVEGTGVKFKRGKRNETAEN